MSGPFVVVQLDDADGPGFLADVLERRNRPTLVLRLDDSPPAVDDVRGVAVLGARGEAPALPAALADWLAACREGGVPLLVMSEGCNALAGTPSSAAAPDMVRVDLTPDSADDPVFGDVPSGSLWPVTAPALPDPDSGTAALLVDTDGNPVAARGAEPVYLTRLAPYRRAADLAEQLGEHAEAITAAARFLDAMAVALVGRWVDAAVGRTEEETPWGRKGPQPVPRAGLSLNPLPA